MREMSSSSKKRNRKRLGCISRTFRPKAGRQTDAIVSRKKFSFTAVSNTSPDLRLHPQDSDVDISRDTHTALEPSSKHHARYSPTPSAEKVYADKNGSRGRNKSDRDEVYAKNYHTQRMLSIL
nr:serine/arginine repetitive matrix protein 1 isoform X5 [Ipomoea batatas]